MKTSPEGLKFIAGQEGFVPRVYHDIAGIPTIGYGHVLKMGDPVTVTEPQAMDLLRHDIAAAESAINSMVKVELNQNQVDSLVSFVFNLGSGALATSALLHFINLGAFMTAADEFPKWCHARVNGEMVVVAGLLKRRQLERALFLSTAVEIPPPGPLPITINDAPPVLPDEGQPTPPGDLPET
jgi:lysozyme